MKIWTSVIILFLVSLMMIAAVSYAQETGKTSRSAAISPAAVKAINEMGSDLEKLNESHENLIKAVGELDSLYAKLAQKTQQVSRLAAEAKKSQSDRTNELFKVIGEMQEHPLNAQYPRSNRRCVPADTGISPDGCMRRVIFPG